MGNLRSFASCEKTGCPHDPIKEVEILTNKGTTVQTLCFYHIVELYLNMIKNNITNNPVLSRSFKGNLVKCLELIQDICWEENEGYFTENQ